MTSRPRSAAEQGVKLLQAALQKAPPPGVRAQSIVRFFQQHGEQITVALQAQLEQASQAPSGYEVLVHAIPNPDFGGGSYEAVVEIPRRWVRVRSLAEASERVRSFITEFNLGSGNWIGGQVRQSGRSVARISYNGRIWQTDDAGRQTGHELSPDGKVLGYHAVLDETKAPCGCQHAEPAPSLPTPSRQLPGPRTARSKRRKAP